MTTPKVYLVSYDLTRGTERDYATLIQEFQKCGAVRILKSQWFIKSVGPSKPLADHFLTFMDKNDRILVTEVRDPAGLRILNEAAARRMLDDTP